MKNTQIRSLGIGALLGAICILAIAAISAQRNDSGQSRLDAAERTLQNVRVRLQAIEARLVGLEVRLGERDSKGKKIKVAVGGEVNTPGYASLEAGSTLMDALATAGGPTRRADLHKIKILRGDSEIKVPRFNRAFRIPLEDGDTIVLGVKF